MDSNGSFFDTGCNNTSEGASGSDPACASSESYSKELKHTLTCLHAKLGNQEHHRMHNSGLLSGTQHSEEHLTYKGPCYGDFQMYHPLYTTVLYKLKELFFSGGTLRHKDRPQPRGKCSVQGTSEPRYCFEGDTTSAHTNIHEQRSFALEFTSLLVIKP